jgi:transcription initiation factor IIE alpha subunit
MEYFEKRIFVDHQYTALGGCSDCGSAMRLSDDTKFSKRSTGSDGSQNFVDMTQSLRYSHQSLDQNIKEVATVALPAYNSAAVKVFHDTASHKL